MSKVWRYWLIAAAAATAAYFFVPEGARTLYYDFIGLSAAGAMFAGLWIHRAEPRSAWILLAFGVLILAAGDIAYGDYKPVPSVADMLYLSGYAIFGTGLISLIRGRVPQRNRSAVKDVAAIAFAVLIASAVLLGRAYAKDVGLAGRAVAMAYPVMDLILLGLVARLALTDRAPRACYVLLGAAFILLLAADVGYTLQNFGTAYSVGGALDGLWLLGYVCFGAAMLHPSLRQPLKAWVPVSAAAAGAARSPVRTPAGARPSTHSSAKVSVTAGDATPRASAGSSMGTTVATLLRAPAELSVTIGDAPLRASSREPILPAIAFQSVRLRRVLAWAGLAALGVAAVGLLLGVGERSTEMIFFSGMYGTTGSVMLISSAVHSYS